MKKFLKNMELFVYIGLGVIICAAVLLAIPKANDTPVSDTALEDTSEEAPPEVEQTENDQPQVEEYIKTSSGYKKANPNVDKNAYDINAFSSKDGFIYYDSEDAKTGIDVSDFQGDIDWKKVADAGVEFAMIRAGLRGYGNGTVVADDSFDKNVQGALDAGLQVGVYFFSQAINAQEAADEAKFTVELASKYDITYPIAFDWEYISYDEARTDDMTSEILDQCAVAFCDTVKEAGYIPCIYFNSDLAYVKYDVETLSNYEMWLASYTETPDFYYHFNIWQYSYSGKIDGIDENVDLNISFKKYE